MLKPRKRTTLLVLAVLAATAVIAGATVGRPVVRGICWMLGFCESTYYGWHTGQLHPGDTVVISQDFRGRRPAEVIRHPGSDGDWDGVAPAGDILATSGSRASVLVDPAWDEDSCYPDRPVAIKLLTSDIEVAVPRVILHR